MKRFIILTIFTACAVYMFLKYGANAYTKQTYIEKRTLDMASPLDVTIDVEFLRELNPAYEQQ
ncbi:MAG TPA: hypothetical protein PKK54_01000 [bacterium]|jgi:hypothetical protein|nr:hypothetical protein [bacterium]